MLGLAQRSFVADHEFDYADKMSRAASAFV